MSWRRLHSRSGVATAPRKYFVVTMLAELTLQKFGNSTPRCSKLTDPSRQFVITTSRRSQVTSSYGWTPSVVHTRARRRPLPVVVARLVSLARLLPLAPPDDVPTAPVIPSPLRLRRPCRPDEELSETTAARRPPTVPGRPAAWRSPARSRPATRRSGRRSRSADRPPRRGHVAAPGSPGRRRDW